MLEENVYDVVNIKVLLFAVCDIVLFFLFYLVRHSIIFGTSISFGFSHQEMGRMNIIII